MSKAVKKKVSCCTKYICPIFGAEVWLLAGIGVEELENFYYKHRLKYQAPPMRSSEAETRSFRDSTGLTVCVWVENIENYYDMVHEALHLVDHVFATVGIPFDSDNAELIAYYQGYWVRKFWKEMSKH